MSNEETCTASQAKDSLHAAGIRATASRIAVMRWLADASKPQSHAEVVNGLSGSGVDQSTLFRCLNELADVHLVARLDLGDHVRRFELAEHDGTGETGHAHFMCVDCGELTCLHGFTVEVTPERGRGRRELGQITEVLLRGRCGACEGV